MDSSHHVLEWYVSASAKLQVASSFCRECLMWVWVGSVCVGGGGGGGGGG